MCAGVGPVLALAVRREHELRGEQGRGRGVPVPGGLGPRPRQQHYRG